ncbi:ribosome biogenesis protein WDR12 homolog [Halyomorpha halys]|uniref:ribosome biogenesis protein WDR12 homolog n=1 Tax=Halyomorpha halys TaxID=286706 RepID=UPI0006D4F9A6|nr:ribosome biogenesis protein WDR12 homolog [Halyomorpha halys]
MTTNSQTIQLQIRFLTKQEQYAVSDTPFAVDSTITSDELNSLVNQLIKENSTEIYKKIEFDFLAGDHFIRTDLGQHIASRGLSSETVIDVEYVERLPAPEPQDCLLHDDWVSAVHVCNNWILSGCYDDTVHLWSKKGKHKLTIPGHTKGVKAVSWISENEDSATFVSVSHDQTALLWEWNMKENVVECVHVCRGHARGIECVGVSNDKTKFATGAWDNMLKIWSASMEEESFGDEDGETDSKRSKKEGKSQVRTPKMTLKGHREAVSGLSWLSSSELVTSSWDHTLRTWDISVGASVSQISGNKAFFDVHYSSLNGLLITGSADRHVRMYDPRSTEGGICKATFTSHDAWVMCVRWSPTDEKLFISGSHDSKLKLWDIRSPSVPLFDMVGHEDKILCCDWTFPDLVVSGGTDNTLRLYKTSDFKTLS